MSLFHAHRCERCSFQSFMSTHGVIILVSSQPIRGFLSLYNKCSVFNGATRHFTFMLSQSTQRGGEWVWSPMISWVQYCRICHRKVLSWYHVSFLESNHSNLKHFLPARTQNVWEYILILDTKEQKHWGENEHDQLICTCFYVHTSVSALCHLWAADCSSL